MSTAPTHRDPWRILRCGGNPQPLAPAPKCLADEIGFWLDQIEERFVRPRKPLGGDHIMRALSLLRRAEIDLRRNAS